MFAKQKQTSLLIVCDVEPPVRGWGKNKENKRFPSEHASELIGSEYKSGWYVRMFDMFKVAYVRKMRKLFRIR